MAVPRTFKILKTGNFHYIEAQINIQEKLQNKCYLEKEKVGFLQKK